MLCSNAFMRSRFPLFRNFWETKVIVYFTGLASDYIILSYTPSKESAEQAELLK